MDTKLTLSLDQDVIRRAKAFAKRNHTSLSQLFEQYLSGLTRTEVDNTQEEISPLVKSLSGILNLPDDFDHKKERTKYLEEKYK